MQSKRIKALIHRLAEEYNLKDEDVREIVGYQFKFLRKMIASASKKKLNYKALRLKNLGIFYVPKGKIEAQRKNFYGEDYYPGGSEE